jgi:hypothetical protein
MAAAARLLAYEADRSLEDGSWAAEPSGFGYNLDTAPRGKGDISRPGVVTAGLTAVRVIHYSYVRP